jgi:exodeoxyribonuclease-3
MPLVLATWNVNSIRSRLDHVLSWLADHEPDVLCMQETKVEDELFPRAPFLELGYHLAIHGGRALAGVATATKAKPDAVWLGFREGEADRQARVLEVVVDGVRIYNLYAPNGTQVGSEAFHYKLAWFARLRAQLAALHRPDESIVVVGDFNVAPDARDVWDTEYFRGRLQFTDDEHHALAELCGFGLADCFRKHVEDGGHYTWFDYRTGGFAKNEGMRIDLVLATAPMLARNASTRIDLAPRRWDGPSDHAPVVAMFE